MCGAEMVGFSNFFQWLINHLGAAQEGEGDRDNRLSAADEAGEEKQANADIADGEVSDKADDEIWSYTIITVDAAPSLRWLHNRMPAVLETDDDVTAWLSPDTPAVKALSLLHPVDNLTWHMAHPDVGNIRNNVENYTIEYVPRPGVEKPNPLLVCLY